jgi:hypothetical protein
MRTKLSFSSPMLLSLFVSVLLAVAAEAETTNCTAITTLPYTISVQGIYCLTSDLSTGITSGGAITIATNNVVLDLNGFKLGNLAAGKGTSAYGINAEGRKNLTIRNGTVRGFYMGVYFYDIAPYTTSQGHLIEEIRADMNTAVGIQVRGRSSIIRNNQVIDTGGSTFWAHPIGIQARGPGNWVFDNEVYETKEQGSGGEAKGISIYEGAGTVVDNNRIGNSASGSGTSYGIGVLDSDDAVIVNNRITKMNYGVYYDSSTGKYRDNLTSGIITAPFSGGTDAGNNN